MTRKAPIYPDSYPIRPEDPLLSAERRLSDLGWETDRASHSARHRETRREFTFGAYPSVCLYARDPIGNFAFIGDASETSLLLEWAKLLIRSERREARKAKSAAKPKGDSE